MPVYTHEQLTPEKHHQNREDFVQAQSTLNQIFKELSSEKNMTKKKDLFSSLVNSPQDKMIIKITMPLHYFFLISTLNISMTN